MNIQIPKNLSLNQKNFLKRGYSTDLIVYINRLKAIDFENKSRVLDAGCGFGQWSIAMAQLNENIVAFDADKQRIETAKMIANENGIGNIDFQQGFLESFKAENESFDAIFSYSVLYLSNHKKSIENLSRLLKKGGQMYLNFNSYGIIPFILFERAIKRKEKESFNHFNRYFFNLFRKNKRPLHAISVKELKRILEQNNLKIIKIAGDGEINYKNIEINQFYPATYWRLNNVVEIIAEKI